MRPASSPASAAASNASATASATSTSNSAVQAKTYPPGDVSHIPGPLQPVHRALQGLLTLAQSAGLAQSPQFGRMYADCEKRFQTFYHVLNHQGVSPLPAGVPMLEAACVEALGEAARAVEARDWAAVLAVQQRLMAQWFSATGAVMLGVKRLVDVLSKR